MLVMYFDTFEVKYKRFQQDKNMFKSMKFCYISVMKTIMLNKCTFIT